MIGARRSSHTAFGGIPRRAEQYVPIVQTSKLELTTPLTADSLTRVSHEFAARGKVLGERSAVYLRTQTSPRKAIYRKRYAPKGTKGHP